MRTPAHVIMSVLGLLINLLGEFLKEADIFALNQPYLEALLINHLETIVDSYLNFKKHEFLCFAFYKVP